MKAVELFYRRYGKGQPLIMLHGMFEMSDNWVPFARIWARKFDVIIPDLRNHGKSPHHPVHTYQAMAEDINWLMNKLNLTQAIFIGYSMGGRLAMLFAQLNPQLVKKLVIIDISPRKYAREEFFKEASCIERFEKMAKLNLSKFSSREQIQQELDKILQNPKLTKIIMKNIVRQNNSFKWKFNLEAINNNYDKLRDQVLDPNIKINTPTLFIRGEKSKYIQQPDIQFIDKIFTNYTVKTIPNATHFLPIEKPQQLLDVINEFIEE